MAKPKVDSLLSDKRFLHIMAEVSPAGMVVVDAEGKIVYVNRQALTWLGYEEHELAGKTIEMLVPANSRSYHEGLRQQFSKHPQSRAMAEAKDLFAQRKDGSSFPVDISLHPFQSNGNNYVLANMLDATQRRQAAELPQERLKAIGVMVSGLAHESRNALQRARASLDLLELDLQDNDEHLELTQRIRKSLDDLEHNYDEVRGYAAPIVLDVSEVNFRTLFQEVIADLDCEFENLPGFQTEFDNHVETNFVDRYRMKQVLRNCLENALQAGAPPEQMIVIRVSRLQDKRCWQVIEIIDQGQGLSEAVAERMFEPFFTTKQKGTGLGLAICRRIIEAHEGIIFAANNAEAGTTVTLKLPLNQ